MRYVFLVLLGAGSVILSGSLMSGLNIAGIQVDLVLMIILSLALLEKTSMPIIFAAAAGLLMDILFSTVLGVYAIGYTAVALLVCAFFKNSSKFNILFLFIVGAGGYIIKELITALIVFILNIGSGTSFNLFSMMTGYILPAALLNGALMFVVYFIMSKIYSNNWMRPKRMNSFDELDL
ncbi:MAG: rod shape-determining protein MreD [Christensenellaceae bacterium]